VRSAQGNAWETEQLRLDEAPVRRAVKKLLADPVKGRAFVVDIRGGSYAGVPR
jgi:hypothetical protein